MRYKIVEKRLEEPLLSNQIPLKYDEVPDITGEEYTERINNLWRLPQAKEYDMIIIYGDREHFSNMYYFTGYDPRFEEALLILRRDLLPVLIVGLEGRGYAAAIPYQIEVKLYENFGLMGQPGRGEKDLIHILRESGVGSEVSNGTENKDDSNRKKVGLIGWKTYENIMPYSNHVMTDVPSYIVEAIVNIVGWENIGNALDLLMDCEYGLRHKVSAKEIIRFEAIGTKVSRNVYQTIARLHSQMSEIDASENLHLDGEPANMHPNINFGEKNVALGLASPGYHSTLQYGDWVGVGYGLRGCLVHRCGLYVRNREEISKENEGYIEKFLKPYFSNIIHWYEMMNIGEEFGKIYDMVQEELGMEQFNIVLNPGHLTHTDEWTTSPFQKNNKQKIHSGLMLQCDYTVSFTEPYMTSHMEDGLAIADEKLQEEIKGLSPLCYDRIMTRKKFMEEQLHIRLPKEVLPLSDLSGVCFPFMADTSVILVKDESK